MNYQKSSTFEFYNILCPETLGNYICSPISIDQLNSILQICASDGYIDNSDLTNIFFEGLNSASVFNKFYPESFRNLLYGECTKQALENAPVVIKTGTLLLKKEGLGLSDDLRTELKEKYDSDIMTYSTNQQDVENTTNKANEWVKEKTNNLIDNCFNREMLERSVAVIASSIYFKGFWLKKFNDAYEDMLEFSYFDKLGKVQKTNKVIFMSDSKMGQIGERKVDGITLQYVKLRYQVKSFYMEIMMPTEINDFERVREVGARNPDLFEGNYSFYDKFSITIPKFKISSDLVVHDAMNKMGIYDIFKEGPATSKLGAKTYISSILQKACIEVDKDGTKAAAVTYTSVRRTSITMPKVVTINQPFYYRLVYHPDKNPSNKLVLFMGQVNNVLELQ